MDKKIMIIAIVVSVALIVTLVIVFLPPGEAAGERKAIIICSANDFYGTETEDDFNNGADSKFDNDGAVRWTKALTNCTGDWDQGRPGHNETGSIFVEPLSSIDPFYAEFLFNWTEHYSLLEYAFYNISAWVSSTAPIAGLGAQIGLRWLDSSNQIVRNDWSTNVNTDTGGWVPLNITGVCSNDSGNEITQLKLVMAVNGTMLIGNNVFFDDVKIDRWIAVNVTDPTDPNPPPNRIDSDGFPAQALQVYWVLKYHGYTDDNIFLMLYHTNDNVIDIQVGGSVNDLIGAIIDVNNDDVNASRAKHELNVSAPGSFASQIQTNDQLIIYMGDHGSNGVLADKNATFHFEADNSYITEREFYNLASNITCARMMINIDCCFSGNFLNENSNFGGSWYNIPNSILISAAENRFSWYWININNPDGFAGSWFFHQFWDQLNQSQSIAAAFNFATNWIPAGRMTPLAGIQVPLMQDNLGISNSWSFNSVPSL